jgi:hypothetical protein
LPFFGGGVRAVHPCRDEAVCGFVLTSKRSITIAVSTSIYDALMFKEQFGEFSRRRELSGRAREVVGRCVMSSSLAEKQAMAQKCVET